MQNSEETELRKINEKCVLDREEQRLNLIEELHALAGKFGNWGTREYAEHGDMIRAGGEAFNFLYAALNGNKSKMKECLNAMVWELGYRMKIGRFED